jgi:hypothetical protein
MDSAVNDDEKIDKKWDENDHPLYRKMILCDSDLPGLAGFWFLNDWIRKGESDADIFRGISAAGAQRSERGLCARAARAI